MKRIKKIFLILFLFFFSQNAFSIEEIVPNFEESEPVFAKMFAQKEVYLNKTNKIEYGVNYKGINDFTYYNTGDDFASSYPFTIEPYIRPVLGEGRYEGRIAIVPTRDTTVFENKVSGIISDLYMKWHMNENHEVLVGNSRVPIGYEGAESFYNLPFAQRSQIATNIGDARSLGIRFRGNVKKFDYDVGGYLSTRYLQHLNDGGEFIGWIDYAPYKEKENSVFKNLKLGAGLQYGRADDNYTVLSTGAKWNYKKSFAALEYAFAQNYNGHNGFKEGKAQGGNITIGHNLTDKVQIVGRYDFYDPNMKKNDNTIFQYTIGLNWFIIKNRLKLTLDYIFEQQKNNNKNKIMFMTQFMI